MNTKKIDIPQVLVSYAGGSGGEWLAYQISQHDKYYNEEIELEINEFNRCRITGSWREELMNERIPQDNFWTEKEYTGDKLWWDDFWFYAPEDEEKEELYDMIRELVDRSKPKWKIPVHRCHEAWYDVFWADLFTDFRIVTLFVDVNNEPTFRQFQSNIIKKIWWQDLSDEEDLIDELEDKFEKLMRSYPRLERTGTYHDVVEICRKFNKHEPVNYTDMMFALFYHFSQDVEQAIDEVMGNLSDRWNRYNIDQHAHSIPGHHIILDFGKMFVYKEYNEYLRMCEFLEMTPWDEQKWADIVLEYTRPDEEAIITVEGVMERLRKRGQQI